MRARRMIALPGMLALGAATAIGGELRNIALGRPYTLSNTPDYIRCTDADDSAQLTDGDKRGSNWCLFSTVSVAYGQKQGSITIDLGYSRSFEQVNVYSRAPSYFPIPHDVQVLTSADGKGFAKVGACDQSSPRWEGFRSEFVEKVKHSTYRGLSYTAAVPTPGAKARYVRVVMKTQGNATFVFADEIEVLAATPGQLKITERRRSQNGGYRYAIQVARDADGAVTLQGLTPWSEVLFEKNARIDADGKAAFLFSLPSEYCHILRFGLADENGRMVEWRQEWIDYTLPNHTRPAEKRVLETGWEFQKRKPGEDPDPAKWKSLALKEHYEPHDPFLSANDEPENIWYRTTFSVADPGGNVVRLRFNRIRYAPSIYLNHTLVAGDDVEPNLPHTYDLTKFVKRGENELRVEVRDWRILLAGGAGPLAARTFGKFRKETWFAMKASITDKAVEQGKVSLVYPPGGGTSPKDRYGILDRVELVLLPKVFIEDVRVTTSVADGSVRLDTAIRNDTNEPRRVTLSNLIGDIGNPRLMKFHDRQVELLPANTRHVRIESAWKKPVLWWPKAPHLYHVCSTLREDGAVLQTKDTRFGFREVAADGAVIRLNGRPLHLFGTHGSSPVGGEAHVQLRGLAAYNFNTRRTWGGGSPEELLAAADELGFLVIDESNHFNRYTYAGRQFWDNCFSHFKRRAARDHNHPSVIAYSTQNEYGGAVWTPRDWNREKMDELIQRMVRYDPTRLHGHEGSFNRIGDCSGSETILLPHYAAEGVRYGERGEHREYLLPNHYRDWVREFKGTSWEHRPVYIGENGLAWDFRSNLPGSSAMYDMDDDVFRDFRCVKRTFDVRVVAKFMPMEYEGLRRAGLVGVSPNTWGVTPELAEVTRQGSSPFLTHVVEYSHGLAGGRTVTRTVVLHNDFLDGKGRKKLALEYRLREGKAVFDKGRKSLAIADGELAETAVSISAPKVEKRREVELVLRVKYEEKIVFEASKAYSVFPPLARLASRKKIALHDPADTTGAFLKKLSLPCAPCDFAALDPAGSVLLIGRGGVDETVSRNRKEIQAFVDKGGVVIALAQSRSRQWLPVPLVLDTSHPSTINYLRATGHPLLRDVEKDDLKFWGPDNIVAAANYKKPVKGAYRAIADTAGIKGLLWSPLLEIPHGRGAYVLCQLKVIERFEDEPAAGIVFRNLLAYASQQRPAPAKLALVKGVGPGVSSLLCDAGVVYDEVACTPETLSSGYNVVLLTGKVSGQDLENVRRLAAAGATVVLHSLTPESPLLGLLPKGTSLPEVKIDHPRKAVIHTDYAPLTWGMSNQFFYWLGPPPDAGATVAPWGPSPEIAGFAVKVPDAAGARALLNPALLLEVPAGKGRFLVDQVRWDSAEGNHRVKAMEYVRVLFANLGVPVKAKAEKPKKCESVDIARFCNMGFADETAGDGKGGWTDQGSNDLRAVPVGRVMLRGVSFNIIDPGANQGRSCIVLKSLHSKWGIERAAGIEVKCKARALHFLHASAWTRGGEEMARYIVRYEDGTEQAIPIVGKKNIGEWWRPMIDLPQAAVAWSGPNPEAGRAGLYAFPWKNPSPDKTIATIDIESANGKSMPCLVAISAEIE